MDINLKIEFVDYKKLNEHEAAMLSKMLEMEKKYNEKINDLNNQLLNQIDDTKDVELWAKKIESELTEKSKRNQNQIYMIEKRDSKIKELEHKLHLKTEENESIYKQLNKLIEENKKINREYPDPGLTEEIDELRTELAEKQAAIQGLYVKLGEKVKYIDLLQEQMAKAHHDLEYFDAISEKMNAQMPGFDWINALLNGKFEEFIMNGKTVGIYFV